jgi:hypothetical protein
MFKTLSSYIWLCGKFLNNSSFKNSKKFKNFLGFLLSFSLGNYDALMCEIKAMTVFFDNRRKSMLTSLLIRTNKYFLCSTFLPLFLV